MNRYRLLVIILLFGLVIIFNDKHDKFYIISPEGNNVITVLTDRSKQIRYIIDGKYTMFSEMKIFVKLDISKSSYITDGFYGGFDIEGYKWLLLNNNTEILESNLNSKFCLETKHRLGSKGITSVKDFGCNSCFQIDYETLIVQKNNLCKIEFPFFSY